LITLNCISIIVNAQVNDDYYEKFNDRIYFGLGLSLGNFSQLEINPLTGIWIFPQWTVGMTMQYFYKQEGSLGQMSTNNSHTIGASLYTQLIPIPDINKTFHHGPHGGLVFHYEYEYLYFNDRLIGSVNNYQQIKGWKSIQLTGFGYRHKVGGKSAIMIVLLWDINKEIYSPYFNNPFLKAYITFGF
jgi:hypothetical protein